MRMTNNVKAALLALAAIVIVALLLAYIASLNIQTIYFPGVPLHSVVLRAVGVA